MNLKPTLAFLALSAGFLLSSCQSTPVVSNGVTADAITVTFKAADKFTEVRDSMGGPTYQPYLDILSDHLKKKAPGFLQTGQTLAVTFNDIDLAGDFQPGPRAGLQDVRIIKPLYRPRMDLNFVVKDASGQAVKEGQRTLMDLNYQMNSTANMLNNNQPLSYDTLLLTRWLEDEFKK